MRRVIDWFERAMDDGMDFLVYEELISFYAYFGSIFTEIAILWAFFPRVALGFTILLSACVLNVLVCSRFKNYYFGEKEEKIIAIGYAAVFGVIFITGFAINWLMNIILFIVPFLVAGIWSGIRWLQNAIFEEESSKLVSDISEVLNNKFVWGLSQIILIGAPLITFSCMVWQTPIPRMVKVMFILLFGFFAPILCYAEDDFAAQNVFELAYKVQWSKDYEQKKQEFEEKIEEAPEEAKEEVLKKAEEIFKDVDFGDDE